MCPARRTSTLERYLNGNSKVCKEKLPAEMCLVLGDIALVPVECKIPSSSQCYSAEVKCYSEV